LPEGGVPISRYIRPVLFAVSNSHVGCTIADTVINILAYADDIVLLAPSWRALQQLICVLEACCIQLDLTVTLRKLCVWFLHRVITLELYQMFFPTLSYVASHCSMCQNSGIWVILFQTNIKTTVI